MKRFWVLAGVLILALVAGPVARAADDQAAQSYTTAEYNAFQSAVNEKDASQRAKLLEDFIQQYPKSTLLPYVYQTSARAYMELKNYLTAMVHADKLVAIGESVDAMQGLEFARIEMLKTRSSAFFLAFNQRQITTKEQIEQGKSGAERGLAFLDQWKKPEKLTDDQFKQEVNGDRILFNTVGGIAALQMKDFAAAVAFYRAVLAVNPNDALTTYNLGRAYLQQDPPKYMDGFWSVARAIALKIQPGEAQVRTYLKNQLIRYQNPLCDTLVDAQLNELIALAASSGDRPASFSIPSRADLDKTLQEHGTIDAILANLKTGGDTAKVTWLAACGAEFPELGGKVFEATAGDDSVVLKVFTAANEEAISAGTDPNIEVHVAGEPRAKLLKKDDLIAFSAALKSYTPDPFLLVVDKAKIREDTLPAEEKPGKAPAKKAPAKRPPTKKPPAR
jgi:tetratricopeptide (TPR) repeat protein